MKFIIDAQLPPTMASWLRMAGHEVEHVSDAGLESAEDDIVWARAGKHGAAILTKDEDFVERAKSAGALPVVVVWLRIGNCSNAKLRVWLEPRLAGIVQLAGEGSRIIEVI